MKTASLTISCRDVKGIVAKVTSFLYELGANVVDLEQHIEDDRFFMRVEWDLKDFSLNEAEFKEQFQRLVDVHAMDYVLDFCAARKRVALFCSRELHCLLNIINKISIGDLKFDLAFVASNFPDAGEYVGKFDIPFYLVPNGDAQEVKLLEILDKYDVECVGLARYMKVLSEDFLQRAGVPIINVHHSFLPSFVGARPYEEAYDRGVKLIGATSHYVTKELDQGQIIDQRTLRISHGHSVNQLKTMGRTCEEEVFAVALKKHLENKIIVYKNRAIVFN